MTDSPHHLRVFLASPGDVADERSIALKALSDLQYDPLLRGRITIEAVAWDTIGGPPMEANLTPQDAIRRGLPLPSECDIFIAVLWARIGTPVEIEGVRYLSGTHYEYEEALEGNRMRGRPRILVYRRTQKVAFDPDDHSFNERVTQHKQVKEFFKRFLDPTTEIAKGGYNSYLKLEQFRELLERHLRFFVKEFLEEPTPTPEAKSIGENTGGEAYRTHFPTDWRGSPFPGLRPMTTKDEPIFFGRGAETDALAALVRERRFTAVVGSSGCGKSSLVAAGMIPRLKRTHGAESWLILSLTPDYLGASDPFASLAAALMSHLPDLRHKRLASRLREDPCFLATMLDSYLGSHYPNGQVLLIVDQFEELFSTIEPALREPFAETLKAATNSNNLRVLINLRGDFFGKCLDVPPLADLLKDGTFLLPSPSVPALYEMFTRPAERAGLQFEEGLPQRILEDTGAESGALALMAYALDELYHACKEEGVLTLREYEKLGGVQGAIGKRGDGVFEALDAKSKKSLPRVFRELVEVDERGTATRRREKLETVASDAGSRHLVDALTNARLLVQSRGERNVPFVEVAHEALLQSWRRIALWIEEARDDLRLLRQVRLAAEEWDENGRDDAFIWPHERLEPVYGMQQKLGVEFDSVTAVFVRPEIERLQEEWSSPSTRAHRRLAIIDRFAQIGGAGIPLIFAALDDRNPVNVRSNAANALGKIRAHEAVDRLLAMTKPAMEASARVRISAVIALGKIGNPKAVPVLLKKLKKLKARQWGEDSYNIGMRRAAATALGRIADERALTTLRNVAKNDRHASVRRAAVTAARKIEKTKG